MRPLLSILRRLAKLKAIHAAQIPNICVKAAVPIAAFAFTVSNVLCDGNKEATNHTNGQAPALTDEDKKYIAKAEKRLNKLLVSPYQSVSHLMLSYGDLSQAVQPFVLA
jgi:hypothetical protein